MPPGPGTLKSEADAAPGIRRSNNPPSRRTLSQYCHRREGLAFEKLEESAPAGGDITDAVGHIETRDGGESITSAGNRKSLGVGDGAGKHLSAVRKSGKFKHAYWTVPHDGARLTQLGSQSLRSFGTDVENEIVFGNLAHRLDR